MTMRIPELWSTVLHLVFEWALCDHAGALQCDSPQLSFEYEEEEKEGTDREWKVDMLKSCNRGTS